MRQTGSGIVGHFRVALGCVLVVAVLAGALTAWVAREMREGQQVALVGVEVARRGLAITSQTLNGSLMGAISLLGMVQEVVKDDALEKLAPNTPEMDVLLQQVGRAFGAHSVFVVGNNGIIRSSWDSRGPRTTGTDINFRPYYRMAMQGQPNVYAAVGQLQGDRAVYFAAPVRRSMTADVPGVIGAVVARTQLDRVDEILRTDSGFSLLLSPQGLVFASNRSEWVGAIAGVPTPERLLAIRKLRQFGAMFDHKDPAVLPFALSDGLLDFDGRRYAMASTPVHLNDPGGSWKLVTMTDITDGEIRTEGLLSLAVGVLVLFLGLLWLAFLRGNQQRLMAARQLEEYLRVQQERAEHKAHLAAVSLRLQQADGLDGMGRIILDEAHGLLGVLQGVVYVSDPDSAELRLAAAYACSDIAPATLAHGDGLLGQCAVEKRRRLIVAPGDGFWRIRSGLGNALPGGLLIVPILLHDQLLGVAEAAVPGTPTDAQGERFEALTALLAVHIQTQRRSRDDGAVPGRSQDVVLPEHSA